MGKIKQWLRKWLNVPELPITGMSQDVVVPAGGSVSVKAEITDTKERMIITVKPAKGASDAR